MISILDSNDVAYTDIDPMIKITSNDVAISIRFFIIDSISLLFNSNFKFLRVITKLFCC